MPLLTISYLLQFLDKQTLNFASVMGMIQDLVSYLWRLFAHHLSND